MGLTDFISKQFKDVIEFVDPSNKMVICKFDAPDNEIKQGSNVVVREGQAAVFLKEGRLADIMGPGTYSLNTDNFPVLSDLGAFGFAFVSPVKADVYFVSTRRFIDNKWGTKNPIMIRDPEFKMVRIRAFGKYSFEICDVEKFMREVFGAQQRCLTYDIIEYISSAVGEAVATTLGNTGKAVLDIAMHYAEMGDEIQERANADLAAFGIRICDLVVENISLPEAVEKMIDEQSGIAMAKQDMSTFMQYQTARAMRDASQQEGGLAGLGAGMAFGNVIASSVQQAAAPEKEENDISDQVEQLRSLKALLDEGILTQEEFNAKKKEILGL